MCGFHFYKSDEIFTNVVYEIYSEHVFKSTLNENQNRLPMLLGYSFNAVFLEYVKQDFKGN